jgi:hypothetical protein
MFKGLSGNKNNNWKGDDASPQMMHIWIKKMYGFTRCCENCKTTTAKQYDWANKDHQYKRHRRYWMRLCHSCHCKYDVKYNNRKTYGK